MANIKVALERVDKDVDNLVKARLTLVDMPITVLDTATWVKCDDDGAVVATYPYDLDLYRDMRHILLDDGWEVVKVWASGFDGSRCSELEKKDWLGNKRYFRMWLNPNYRGSTCEQVLVGERTVKTYEVRCK